MTYSDTLDSAIGRAHELAERTEHPEAVFALRQLVAAREGDDPDAVADHLQHAELHLELAGIAVPQAEPWFQRAKGTVRRTRRAFARAVERHGPELALDPDLRRVLAEADAEVAAMKAAQQGPLDATAAETRSDRSGTPPLRDAEMQMPRSDRESA